ncbi:MAG: sugar transporter [Acidiphilium sp. 37-64-53]|uniref:polysaccharide biosynthesis/export family protein n=2 Tax=Acidocellaceae TaxID=3385905 RepID=UPI000BC42C44|nr:MULTISPECIES: polysaccharide biosynthesis/export family protein [Acidiphilium]OYW02945.1 MAG: sugar transporter [Acidiphilium sp. 37-64-53]OZB30517.1 MAG: sugar transporter [Acidiphilium sp. 34-64-41]HQT85217.1 polysaccharide biosynthesis/export family protein [Acidiphilium rubrum]
MMMLRESYRRRSLIVRTMASWGVAVLGGCATGGNLPPLPTTSARNYRLGTGDQVRVVVFDQKQLSADYDVSAAGMIDVPLLGPVRAAGHTATGLGRAIAAGLVRRGILRRPEVAVDVRRYRPFSILGEVNKPGQYPFEPGMTVLTAVSIANGFTYRAVQSRVGVIRVRHGRSAEYRAPATALIAPGDVIQVFERHF